MFEANITICVALVRVLHKDHLRLIPDIVDYNSQQFDLEHNSSNRPIPYQQLLEYHAHGKVNDEAFNCVNIFVIMRYIFIPPEHGATCVYNVQFYLNSVSHSYINFFTQNTFECQSAVCYAPSNSYTAR